MTFDFDKIIPICSSFIELDSTICSNLNTYGEMLLEKNKVMNLTAIVEPEEFLYKHFYDCLLFFKAYNPKIGEKIIDVGTGAGFPGVVLKIVRPDLEIHLLDSLYKRLSFLEEVGNTLKLDFKYLHLRAEQAGCDSNFREQYDIATSRAVARLGVLSEYCLPLVKKGGKFIALKGKDGDSELIDSQNAVKLLGGSFNCVVNENLPGGDERKIIIIDKISQTEKKYPRVGTKIAKNPL